MKKLFIVSLLLFILGIIGVLIYSEYSEKKGHYNLTQCESLRSGISKQQIIEILGEPISVHDASDDYLLMFETPDLQSEMIQAKISKKNNIVVGIKCREGAEWK